MSYLYIETQVALDTFCKNIRQNSFWFAIDTEFVRVNTFFAELSLIQIQPDNGDAVIIDPFKISNLNPLWDLISDPKILKVFHSARQDIEVLYQVSGQMPVSIFDTQIASVFLGYGDLAGLSKVLDAQLNIKIPKDQTRTNWSQRPLTAKQLEYAINDVKFLAPLYQQIILKLTAKELTVLQEDFTSLLDKSLYDFNLKKINERVKKADKLPPKNQAISNALALWRENHAIKYNKPRRWVLTDDMILAMARRPPKLIKDCYKISNIKESSIKKFAAQWLSLIDEVFITPESWPTEISIIKPANKQENVLILIGQAISQQLAIDHSLNITNLVTKEQLLNMIRNTEISYQIGWRHFLMEQPFKEFLQEKNLLSLKNNKLIL